MNDSIQNTRILHLLQKYIENKCTEQELFSLLHGLKKSEYNQPFDLVSESLWKYIDSQIAYPDKRRSSILKKEVDLLLQRINQKEKTALTQKTIFYRNWLYRIAAIFLLLLCISTGYYFMGKSDRQEIVYKEISTGRGETKEYTLDDGTHVILNSESKLIIPSDYNDKNRYIQMSGEGFFDVSPDPDHPFIIKNGYAKVKVLGTSFNVKTYHEDDYINVTVSTGNVLVNVDELDLQLRVTPSEHLSINKKTGNLTKLPLQDNKYINWIEGSLFFEKEPINEVIKTINRRYSKNVILQCKDCNYIISGTHDNKSIEAVVEAICFTTGLKYKTDGENIILYEQ